jgi:arginyl-tRNA synthetase
MNFVNPVSDATKELREMIMAALGRAVANNELPNEPIPAFNIEIPADKNNGDFATNVAMVSARTFKLPPRKIAEIISNAMVLEGTSFERVEVAGPGFINVFLSRSWFSNVVLEVEENNENYGRTDFGKSKKVMVEFVSANPTGPMHIGNARGGAIGDCLASVLDWAGYDVTREFYVNDAGKQIEKFGISLARRYLQIFLGEENVEFPEDAYQGEDIKVLAREFADIHGDKYVNGDEEVLKKDIVAYALPLNIQRLKDDLARYRINYDVWFFESKLHEENKVMGIVDMLTKRGLTYEKDGAIFYKASEFGAEKDEVLVRANGIPTYFAADIAYHYNKFAERHFDKVINIWGADHHGHVARLKGAMDAIGLDGNKLDIVLMQLVKLIRNGETVRVSKRTGKSITLTDLLDEVPIDAARFFFNLREANSHLDFDLDLAVEQSSQNPVYYVQYAHARICSILLNLKAEGITPKAAKECNLDLLTATEEVELIRHLSILPNEIVEAAKAYDPARITRYVIDLATLFHKFYNACRVKCDDEALMYARLALCMAVKTVIKNVLTLLKIDAPTSM